MTAEIVHPIGSGDDPGALLDKLTGRERERAPGLHVVVLVSDEGNRAFGRVENTESRGHGAQRWLQHARRGSSPGGWSEPAHPRAEAMLAAWMTHNAMALDRVLIEHSKRAWKLDADAPYVVEFEPLDLDTIGLAELA